MNPAKKVMLYKGDKAAPAGETKSALCREAGVGKEAA